MHKITFLLVIIGALNWLVLALFNWEIGQLFGGQQATVSTIIYVLVGLSGLYEIFTHKGHCKGCVGKSSAPAGGNPTPGI